MPKNEQLVAGYLSQLKRELGIFDDGVNAMVDLNTLKGSELSAAMRGGTDGWGRQASSADNVRYSVKITGRGRRSICSCGCKNKVAHIGMANGLGLTSGCELSIQRWIKTGRK